MHVEDYLDGGVHVAQWDNVSEITDMVNLPGRNLFV